MTTANSLTIKLDRGNIAREIARTIVGTVPRRRIIVSKKSKLLSRKGLKKVAW